ncbi:MAG: ComF family protein [Gallicola sp.]|nr:ComF family protein [Gallicola sp.]
MKAMIKELLFHAKLCLDCHEEWTKSKGLCKDCLEKIEYIYGRNRILSDVDCVFPFYYGGEIKNLLIRYKFRNESYLYRVFTELLYAYIKDYRENWDEIITVPYTDKKAAKRGYEPVTIIGKELSRKLKIDFSLSSRKSRETEDQHFLNAEERIENVKDAFYCNPKVKGKRILLLDDIMTSGATLRELSETLLKAGAKTVDCLVIASEKREEKGYWIRHEEEI